ncbi:hypothetical protein GCM10011409_37930 [Lentibacillus populi]|uniref:DUF1056 family protein n=1 Tax=Lentibacillus populi TaxID=1827502 RepID=A0A9W5X723_9BACI|nr:hypothetical protein [Lentibacillus populi]GGB56778.1 hypothetical protein GCM10011409_37930 [Lentibacillus populi]
MNNKLSELIQLIGSFFMSNYIGIVLLIGLGIIVYGFYRIGTTTGTFALGASFILISLIFVREGR